METIKFTLNGEAREVEVESDKPLLWILREDLKLTGTKFGCGKTFCGACTVHLDGQPIRSCSVPAEAVAGKTVVTIEGVEDHPVQKAWQEMSVPQCGWCQSGQIMAAVALLEKTPKPSDEEIKQAMNGHLCRCGTYVRIHEAVRKASQA